MKKLAILFSIIFVCGIIAASAQTSATTEKQDVKTEKVKGDDGAKKSKGCCMNSSKSCKPGSSKDKAEKSSKECSDKSEAVVGEKKDETSAPNNNR